MLPDADAVQQAREALTTLYQEKGWGAGMAGFIKLTSWEGAITDEYLAQPAAGQPEPFAARLREVLA